MKILHLASTFLLFFFLPIFAQEKQQKFQVDFNEIKGELSSQDSFKKDFGRYDGYEIELFQGEVINIVVYSKKFQPSIALVNSKGEIFKQSTKNDKGYANIVSEISSGGNWILYVIGNEKDSGSYTIQIAIAEPNALSLRSGVDFCTTLNFLISHSKAYFFLLENPSISRQELVKLNDAIDAYIDEASGSYIATFENSNDLTKAEAVFNDQFDRIKKCLGDNWQITSLNPKNTEVLKEKSKTFTEMNVTKPRFVKIIIHDYTKSKDNSEFKYSVDIEINRK
jgi:hypothetical protein